tara:strand:+ start:1243 stop:1458 length:216 start_codon:yes stop_codon:yes gene_type:complete
MKLLRGLLLKNERINKMFAGKKEFDAVLSYCEQRHTSAVQYGLAMGFFNKQNKLTKSGDRVAKILLNQKDK